MGIKGFFSFWDWSVAKLKKIFNKERDQEEDKQDVEDKLSCHEEKMKELMDGQIALNEKLEHLMDKVNLLIALAMGIKGFFFFFFQSKAKIKKIFG